MKNLNIRVAFSAIDTLTRPVSAARQSVGGLSESLRRTQSGIKDLESQSRTFSRLRDSVQKTSRKIDDASRTLEGLNRMQRGGLPLTDRQREHMAALAAKLDRLNAARTQEMEKLRAASQALRRCGVSLAGGDATIQSAIRRTEQYNRTLEHQRQRLADVTRAHARYERMQQVAGGLRAGGATALAAGAGSLYAGARMMAPQIQSDAAGALIAAQSGEASTAGARYSRIIGGIATSGVSNDIGQIAGALSAVRSTLDSTGDAGDTELDRITRRALDMQAAFGGELTGHIQIAAIMMKNGLAASSAEAFDLMTAGMQRVSTQMRGELPEILHEYSTHFRNLGFSGRETMSLLVNMAQQGKFALDKTGDAVKEFSIRGSDMSKSSVAAYEQIGLSAAAMSSAIAGGGGQARVAMQETARGLLAINDPAERANAAIALFGTPLEDLSVDQIPAFLSALARTSDRPGDIDGAAARVGDSLRDSLAGDLGRLGGAFAGLRLAVSGGMSDDLRGLAQCVTGLVNGVRAWVSENPGLTRTLLITVSATLALTAAVGGLSLAIGLLTGPLAKLQPGFTLLTGGRGITGTIAALRTLGMLALRLTGLPATWSMITAAVSVLGTALSLLLSPIGLIVAAFVAAGVLIWRYLEPIKSFFTGFFSGVMQQLAPFRDAFFTLTLVFSAIGRAVGEVWSWFIKLFAPVESSRESLDKCASARETFGKVLGFALQGLLSPLTTLMEGIGWVLDKLDLIPSGLEAARLKAESLKKDPVMWEWDPQQKKMVQKGWNWSPISTGKNDKGNNPFVGPPVPPGYTPPLTGDNGTMRRLQNIDSNTRATADNTKKIGPGDIVFKNLPRALAVRGEWREPQLAGTTAANQSSARPAVVAASLPVRQAALPPVSRGASTIPVAPGGFTGEIHVHLHGADRQDARETGRIVADAVNAELARRERLSRGSFRDRD